MDVRLEDKRIGCYVLICTREKKVPHMLPGAEE